VLGKSLINPFENYEDKRLNCKKKMEDEGGIAKSMEGLYIF